jgi:hypothetical protein
VCGWREREKKIDRDRKIKDKERKERERTEERGRKGERRQNGWANVCASL